MIIDLLHQIVNTFAGGRSTTKVFAFLTFLSSFLIIYFFRKKINIKISNIKIILIINLILLFTTPIFLHFQYFDKYNLPKNEYVVILSDQEITSSRLIHNHIGKSSVSFILNTIKINHFENIDFGHVYKNTLNIFWSIFIFGLFIFQVFLFFIFYLDKLNSIENKKIFTLFYSIISFSILKSAIDGGLFEIITINSIIFLYIINRGKEIFKYKNKIIFLFLLYFIVHFSLYLLNFYSGWEEFYAHINRGWIFACIGFSFLIFIYFKNRTRLQILFLIFTAILVLSSIFNNLSDVFYYKNIEIVDNKSFITSYEKIENTEELYKINNLGFYNIGVSDQIKVGEYSNKNNISNIFKPINVSWNNCIPTDEYSKLSSDLLSLTKLNIKDFKNEWVYMKIEDESILKGGSLYKYKIIAYFHPCQTRNLNVLHEYIKTLGGKTFFLYNPEINNNKISF